MGRISNWFNRCWGWTALPLTDKLKLIAIVVQSGAGMAMTFFAGFALWQLTQLKAIWPVFYLGAGALATVGIIVTGFGALLYKRTVEFEMFGAKFKAADQEAVAAMVQAAQTLQGNKDV